MAGGIEQTQNPVIEGLRTPGRRDRDAKELAGRGTEAVQVHVAAAEEVIADICRVAVGAGGRAQPSGQRRCDRVAFWVQRRRHQRQVQVIVSPLACRSAVAGGRGIIGAVAIPRHTDVVGAGSAEDVADHGTRIVAESVRGKLVARRVEQPQHGVHGGAAAHQRGGGDQSLSGAGLELVEVHIAKRVEAVADVGIDAKGAVGGPDTGYLRRGQRVASRVRGRRGKREVELVVAATAVAAGAGGVGIVIGVRRSRYSEVVGAGRPELVLQRVIVVVREGTQLVAGQVLTAQASLPTGGT